MVSAADGVASPTKQTSPSKRADDRLRFLAEVGLALAASGDDETALETVAALASRRLAEVCMIELPRADGMELRVAAARNGSGIVRLYRTSVRYRPRSERRIRSSSKLWSNATRATINELYDHADGFGTAPTGLRSALRVPIGSTNGVARGALTWMAKRKLLPSDLFVAEELARRIALAHEQRKLKAEARAATKERDQFISVAGHELKTPLASLELHVSALLMAAKSGTLSSLSRQRVIEKLERAHAQIDRITGALEQLLSVRRTRDDGLLLTPTEVDWAAIVREVVDRARGDAERAGCGLSLSARRPVFGRWDGELLERAFSNLLGYALGPGGAQGSIEVVVRRATRGARCSVRYQGVGLSAQEQTALLAPPSSDGTRLGLWIARHIVEAHGGRLSVRSAPGAGVTFVVELPIAEAS